MYTVRVGYTAVANSQVLEWGEDEIIVEAVHEREAAKAACTVLMRQIPHKLRFEILKVRPI